MRRWKVLAMALIVAGCSGGRTLSPIHLVPIMTLGADSGDGAIVTTPVVSPRLSPGFRIVIPTYSTIAVLPLAFGDDGAYLGALRGDSSANGRFDRPAFTRVGPGDSLWVFDNGRRVLLFDTSRRHVRTIGLGSESPDSATEIVDAVILADNRIVSTSATDDAIELRDARGATIRKFGANDGSGLSNRAGRRIALAPDGTLWVTSTSAPWTLEHWDTAGKRIAAFDLDAPWLVDSVAKVRARHPGSDQPPIPEIAALWSDASGRVWVLGAVPDRTWSDGLTRRGTPGSDGTGHIDPDRYFDTIVEVHDPVTGRLIATARFDVACRSIAEPGVLVHERDTHAGWTRAELLRVVLDDSVLRKPN